MHFQKCHTIHLTFYTWESLSQVCTFSKHWQFPPSGSNIIWIFNSCTGGKCWIGVLCSVCFQPLMPQLTFFHVANKIQLSKLHSNDQVLFSEVWKTGKTCIQLASYFTFLLRKLVFQSLFSTRDFIYPQFWQCLYKDFTFPARTSKCYADSLGADIKNTVAGQIHLVLQSPEHTDIANNNSFLLVPWLCHEWVGIFLLKLLDLVMLWYHLWCL